MRRYNKDLKVAVIVRLSINEREAFRNYCEDNATTFSQCLRHQINILTKSTKNKGISKKNENKYE